MKVPSGMLLKDFHLKLKKNIFTKNNAAYDPKVHWKSLGRKIDTILRFAYHNDYIRNMLRKQWEIIPKTRHYVPRSAMFSYNESYIRSIVQYRISVRD